MKLTHKMCIQALSQLDIDTLRGLVAISMELKHAEEKHPKYPISKDKKQDSINFIYATAIVSEETGELTRAALQYHEGKGRYYDMAAEAIQTGSSALRFLKNFHEK
jgi:hypothetical protein